MQKSGTAVLIGAGAGFLLAFVALLFAFLSAGGGHGDYFLVKVLFPYSMLLTVAQDNCLTLPLLLLAFLQFPAYGIAAGKACAGCARWPTRVVILCVLHLIAAILCLRIPLENFS